MKLHINPTIIYRVPQFSYKQSLADCWEQLKPSIANASPAFHQLIKDFSYQDLQQQDFNYKHTVWKYFNRARYRATPYGSFAGIGVATLGSRQEPAPVMDAQQKLHCFADWQCRKDLEFEVSDVIEADKCVQSNHSFYIFGNQIRYLFIEDGKYEISEVPCNETTLQVLDFCRGSVRISQLFDMLPAQTDKAAFLARMLYDQLLICETWPNTLGQDYFERMAYQPKAGDQAYIIAERPLVSGKIDTEPFRYLPAMIERLHQLLPSYETPDLAQFAQTLSARFGEREILLMAALDPELGAGYAGLDDGNLCSPMIGKLHAQKNQATITDSDVTLKALLPLLMDGGAKRINLEDIPVQPAKDKKPLPNTIPVLCSEANGTVELVHVGGATANMLLGRFSVLPAIEKHCKQLAQLEQDANADVLFFDIAYMADGRVDNVNRRRAVYPYQLNILNYGCSASPLYLDDIMVSVMGGKVILRSKSLNKRLVPRFASAYNYTLSNLAVFRLLCDLQHQETHKNLYLRLIDRLPEMDYYPEVYYRNIILSPETWRLNFNALPEHNPNDGIDIFKAHLQQRNIHHLLNLTRYDQSLFINCNDSEDLQHLYTMLQRNKQVVVSKARVPVHANINDTEHKPYVAEYLLTLTHNQAVCIPMPTLSFTESADVPLSFCPGSEWLYFEVFCHEGRANTVLMEMVPKVFAQHGHKIRKWFFIRYYEGGHHLRLRFQLYDAQDGWAITDLVNRCLATYIAVGIVSDVALKTYHREIARYGKGIADVETHFCTDSSYAFSVMDRNLSDNQKYAAVINLYMSFMQAGLFERDVLLQAAKQTLVSFENEHRLGSNQFMELNAAYKAFTEEKKLIADVTDQQLQGSFAKLLYSYPMAQRLQVLPSLVHMHVNRLFVSKQRTHELAIYYFLNKILKAEHSKRKVQQQV